MSRVRRAACLLMLVAAAAGCSATGDSPRVSPPSRPLDGLRLLPPVPVQGDTGYSLAERMRHHRVEAVSVAVVRDFQVAWSDARGLADRETGQRATTATLFQAGSISKPVTAAAVMRKAQGGELQLDRDVNDYLRSWRLPGNELTAKRAVSLDLILSHGAGLTIQGFPGYGAGASVPTVPQVLDGLPPANTGSVRVDVEPGSRWFYSGGGYTIAQLVMTDRFGAPFPELMQSLVLGPVGMADSTFAQPLPPERLTAAAAGYRSDGSPVPGKRHTYPEMAAAGLWATAGDLARFVAAVQLSLRGDDGSMLARETAARMVTPFTGEFGLGFHVETRGGETYCGHNGADEGFQAVLLAHRDKGYGVAVMTNSDNGAALAAEIVRGVARAERWEGYLPPPPRVVVLPAAELEAIAGRYALNGDEAVVIEARDGLLSGTAPGVGRIGLLPTSRDSLVSREAEVTFALDRDGDREGALAAYRKVLDVLPADPAASAALKQQLESNARAKIGEITR